MSMPIQRQSESFGYFDEGPRFARDRSSTDLPRGLAGLINTSGPRITGGMLNTRTANPDGCEYCGEPGHDWQVHPEAHRDVADWEREKYQQEFPFGDYTEGIYPSEDDHAGEAWPGHQASRLAVNTDGMDPNSHAYGGGAGDPLFGEFGHDGYDYEGVSQGEFNRRTRDYDPDEASAIRREELEDEDDDSGYNWGPDPSDQLHPDDIPHSPTAESFDTPIYNPRSAPYDEHTGSRHPFDRTAGWFGDWLAAGDHPSPVGIPWEQTETGYRHPTTNVKVEPSQDHPGEWQTWLPAVSMPKGGQPASEQWARGGRHTDPQVMMDWHDYQHGGPAPDWYQPRNLVEKMFGPSELGPRRQAAAPEMDPTQIQPPQGGGYQIGHRIGLPWRDQVIPGTVIGLDGPQVAVRWDDGQHSSEEPRNIHLL